jgi:hypothetical protein
MVSLVESEGTTKTQTNPPDEAKEQGQQTTRPAQHEKHHASEEQHLVVEVEVKSAVPRDVRQAPGRTEVAGPMSVSAVPLLAVTVPSHVFGTVKSRGVLTPADSTKVRVGEVRGKGGPYTPLDRPLPAPSTGLGADTVVSIEREVVSGHTYAILAPEADSRGSCGHDRPTFLSVNGVSDP